MNKNYPETNIASVNDSNGCAALIGKRCGLCAGWPGSTISAPGIKKLAQYLQDKPSARIEDIKSRLCGPQTTRLEQSLNELNPL